MKRRASIVALAVAIATATLLQSLPSTAAPGMVAGAGVWVTGGRVSTLEMVGLNPQPEPPSRTAIVVYTSGASFVSISLSCATSPQPGTFVGTGVGSNGRWYQVVVVDRGLPNPTARGGDLVGIASLAFPPNPCSDPGIRISVVGDFIVR